MVETGSTPLLALIVRSYDPTADVGGVPLRDADPLPWSTNVTPAGSVPDTERSASGYPSAE
jgi:hypothetical protein